MILMESLILLCMKIASARADLFPLYLYTPQIFLLAYTTRIFRRDKIIYYIIRAVYVFLDRMSESKTLKIFESDYYRTYKNSVKLIGLWPHENIHKKRITRFFITALLTTFMILQLQFLYEQIQGHWDTITNKRERQILEQSASESQFLSKFYMGASYVALVVYTASPVLVPIILDIALPLNESRRKTFPYFIEYFIDTEFYYYQLMVHGTICFTISVLVYISIDTMYAACCQHLCGLFDIVEHRLKEAVKTNSNRINLEPDRTDILMHKLLNEAITLHQDSIEFAVLIENTYALCYLLVLGLNLAVIVLAAVDIVINLDDTNQIIRLSILYIAFSFHLFFNSVPGQKIHDKSVNVMNSAYFSEWYNLPLNARKLIQLIIHRSLNPCQFTAGGLFVLNIENFGSIMKSSMSYITVLASIR
ncbi:odorant receptor 156 isoform X1 [Nasonia vitripennis]|uniref:Odorant receptor n=1 Tax=Nasonia vitripennis TaxID=7425 RepID=A0A7M7Q9A9_NASVI|nr:odorant receptor 156 isoform X1 [Nasonia vitripennis]